MRAVISHSYAAVVAGKFQKRLSTYGGEQEGCWYTINE